MREIDWYSMGQKRAYEQLTGNANSSAFYPTRDKYSEDDENSYCMGYADGIERYRTFGFFNLRGLFR